MKCWMSGVDCPGGIEQISPAVPTLAVLLSPPWRPAPVPVAEHVLRGYGAEDFHPLAAI